MGSVWGFWRLGETTLTHKNKNRLIDFDGSLHPEGNTPGEGNQTRN